MQARSRVTFIGWTARPARAHEIARALGGEALCIYDTRLARGPLIPLRYALSAVRMLTFLVARRPASIIVTNPPIIPGMLAAIYGRVTGSVVVLDSHPGGFGAQGDRMSARMQSLHRWTVRRVSATMVTTPSWCDVVERWGGRALVVHEAPPEWQARPAAAPNGRLRVLFGGIFAPDEPYEAMIDAAKLVPHLDIALTGDARKCPDEVRERAGANVRFLGYLDAEAYQRAVEEADVVVSLTTEPTSVMRVAYEAVYANRPLVVSAWPALADAFPYAVQVQNTPPSIAAGLVEAEARHEDLRHRASEARSVQLERWTGQLRDLRGALRLPEPEQAVALSTQAAGAR